MNPKNIYEEIKKLSDDLNRKTLEYYVNSFIYACDIDIDDGYWDNVVSIIGIPYINKNTSNYNISFARLFDRKRGKNITLIGKYKNLNFYFISYYGFDNKKNNIVEIPYIISLVKYLGDLAYCLKIEVDDISQINVHIIESTSNGDIKQEIVFTSKDIEYSRIMKFIKGFNNNPELIFNIYNYTPSIGFEELLNKISVEDSNLDKPQSKLKKIFNKIKF